MAKKKDKRKGPTVVKLKKRLWKLFSAWARARDTDCQSCYKKNLQGSDKQGGHIIPRSVGGVVLYFHPLNVWTQCSYDNNWLGGNGAIFAANISKKLGFNITEYLETIRRETKAVQWNVKDLQVLIECLENEGDYEKVHRDLYRYDIL